MKPNSSIPIPQTTTYSILSVFEATFTTHPFLPPFLTINNATVVVNTVTSCDYDDKFCTVVVNTVTSCDYDDKFCRVVVNTVTSCDYDDKFCTVVVNTVTSCDYDD